MRLNERRMVLRHRRRPSSLDGEKNSPLKHVLPPPPSSIPVSSANAGALKLFQWQPKKMTILDVKTPCKKL